MFGLRLDKLNRNPSEGSRSRQRVEANWIGLWALEVKPKLMTFLWKCIREALAVAGSCDKRGLEGEKWCKLCGDQVETVNHLLYNCERARRIWKISPVQWERNAGGEIKLKEWFSINLMWWLWCSRNKWTYEGKRVDDRDVVSGAVRHWMEFDDLSQIGG